MTEGLLVLIDKVPVWKDEGKHQCRETVGEDGMKNQFGKEGHNNGFQPFKLRSNDQSVYLYFISFSKIIFATREVQKNFSL